MKIIPTLVTVMLSVVCIGTGCQSPKALASSGNNTAQSATNSIGTGTARASANSAPTDRILVIDPSSMPIAGGKATLIIGALQRTKGVYAGDYKIKVFPYFSKNEKGTLAIVVSDESLAKLNQGKVAAIIGKAKTNGEGGHSRPIGDPPTPRNITSG